jgi:iron-sulfur cluster protein
MSPRISIDDRLKSVLQDFSRSYLDKREAVLRGYDFESLRAGLAEAKDRALERNAELLDRFEERARGHGSRVLRVKDGDEANRTILRICRDHGITRMVKSKSMVSEETGLNTFLAVNGVTALETDLGEWIVQLAAEAPTHMVMPAIHLTRGEVARLFEDKLGRPVAEDIPALVRIARDKMRQEIFAAQAGFSGANVLIAEAGAVVVVTNEGNGRLVATVPPVHVVLATIEKVIPTVEDAIRLLRVLPRSATGQSLTSYVSFIAGPHAAAQYIILLDNHRSEMLADPTFRAALRCIKCSACLNVCPVYQIVGGAQYAHVYMGGIGTLFTAWIHGLRESKNLARLCLRCHRCESYCPTKIPIAGLITALAECLNAETGRALWKRLAFDGMMSRPPLHRTAFSAARKARRVIAQRDGFARRLPPGMKKHDRFRALPAPAKVPFSKAFRKEFGTAAKLGTKDVLTLFAGCLIEHFYPEVGLAATRVLRCLGYGVKLAPARCCGFPASNAGHRKASARAFDKLLGKFEAESPVITLCPTCTTMLAEAGPAISGDPKARDLAARITPFSQFLAEHEVESLPAGGAAGFDLKITYHESCHHRNVLAAEKASRLILGRLGGRAIVEMDEPDRCCGFAGGFTVENPEISAVLLADKIAAVQKTGAGIVALDCPGCLLQIRGGCARAELKVRVAHTAELVAESLNKAGGWSSGSGEFGGPG